MAMAYLLQLFDETGKPQLKGNRTIKADVRWVDLGSFSFPTSGSGGGHFGGGAGKVNVRDINITLDAGSEAFGQIYQAVASGKPFAKAIIDGFKDEVWALRIVMVGVMFSSAQVAGGSDKPMASATITFDKLTTEYHDIDPNDSSRIKGAWQSETNDNYDSSN